MTPDHKPDERTLVEVLNDARTMISEQAEENNALRADLARAIRLSSEKDDEIIKLQGENSDVERFKYLGMYDELIELRDKVIKLESLLKCSNNIGWDEPFRVLVEEFPSAIFGNFPTQAAQFVVSEHKERIDELKTKVDELKKETDWLNDDKAHLVLKIDELEAKIKDYQSMLRLAHMQQNVE